MNSVFIFYCIVIAMLARIDITVLHLKPKNTTADIICVCLDGFILLVMFIGVILAFAGVV